MHACTQPPEALVSRYAEASVPTEYGKLRVVVYHEAGTPHEHAALVYGDIQGKSKVLARVHSECFTGEVLHSLKCDCREQLDYALRAIVKEGAGIVIYLRQEGRGIGLGNKIRAYALQERGVDTVDANRMLGFADDLRRYHAASAILNDFGIQSVRLLTNNPTKVEALVAEGLEVERVPVSIEPHPHNRDYLHTKRLRMGHLP
jgi:GTP cyclohydrolase II